MTQHINTSRMALFAIATAMFSTASALVSLPAAANPPDFARIDPNVDRIHWQKTPATGIADVGLSRDGAIWVAGKNGTIWFSNNGQDFTEQSGISGFGRVAVGEDNNELYAVGRDNHTLWHGYLGSTQWTETPATGVADVAVGMNGHVWIVGTNGTIWFSTDKGAHFRQVKADGFCRIGTHSRIVWAVGCNGTLWSFKPPGPQEAWDAGEWQRTDASDIADVTGDEFNSIWMTGQNGTVWQRINAPLTPGQAPAGFVQISGPAGFVSISEGKAGVYAVRADGTLWRYVP